MILTKKEAEEQKESLDSLRSYISGFKLTPISESKATLC